MVALVLLYIVVILIIVSMLKDYFKEAVTNGRQNQNKVWNS